MNIEHRTSNIQHPGERSTGARSLLDVRCSILDVARVLLIAAFVILLLGRAFAGSASADFDSANKLYEQAKYADAAAAYEKMIQSGETSPAVYFNLGNAYYKSGETGRAIAAYRKGKQLDPHDPDLRANLNFVRNQVQGPTVSPERWESWLGRLSADEWASLAAAAFWVWLLLLAAVQLRPALRSGLRVFVWGSGLAAAALGICLGLFVSFNSGTQAVVIAGDVAVHLGPLEESKDAFTAHDGAELKVLDRKNGWLEVTAGQQRTGWLKADQVVVLSRRVRI